MYNDNQNKKKFELSIGIKVAAFYLIFIGGIGVLWPLTGFGPHHVEFQTMSFAYKLGSYARENLINFLFLISGIGIFYKKVWARNMALIILVISTIYSSNNFAWGFSNGQPTLIVRFFSFLILGLWNGLWFYLIYKVKLFTEDNKNNG